MTGDNSGGTEAVEFKPHFHEWATVQPGMICLARKKRTAVFRQYVAAETAVPVIACAACLPFANESQYFFAGVARSKSVRDPDDGIGPKTDEVIACLASTYSAGRLLFGAVPQPLPLPHFQPYPVLHC